MKYLKPEQIHFIKEIKQIHSSKKEEIKARLAEFKEMWRHGTREEIFQELVFCIITPMARGKYCWHAIENMKKTMSYFMETAALFLRT